MKQYDIIVIGAGVVGAFIARELSKYQLNVLLLEKENDVGNKASGANSAIIHSGYDPYPNSLKAKFNVLGNKMFDDISKELDVKFSRIGSLTVATNNEQMATLLDLSNRGKLNGVDTTIINKEELIKLEPNVSKNAVGALFAKTAGIIDPFTLVHHAVENALDNGVSISLGEEVVSISANDLEFSVSTNKNQYITKYIINAAGMGALAIAKMLNPSLEYEIKARKGEYYVLDHYGGSLVKHVIFPLPTNKGKGILITPTTSNNFLVGPSSEFVFDEDDLSTDKETLTKVKEQANELINNIPYHEVIRTFSGLRTSSNKHDFIIEKDVNYSNFINLLGIESPGLVSSPAIAKYVVEEFVDKYFKLVKKENFNPYVRKYIRTKELTLEQKNELAKINKDYSDVVCFCEQVTLGEIKDLLSRSVPIKTIKALRKYLRIGFGKCQSGFCQPRALIEIAKYYNLKLDEVLYDNDESNILYKNVKRGN